MLTKNSHMNPVYGKEEVDSVTDYINSGGWIMEHTKTRELESLICNFTGASMHIWLQVLLRVSCVRLW